MLYSLKFVYLLICDFITYIFVNAEIQYLPDIT